MSDEPEAEAPQTHPGVINALMLGLQACSQRRWVKAAVILVDEAGNAESFSDGAEGHEAGLVYGLEIIKQRVIHRRIIAAHMMGVNDVMAAHALARQFPSAPTGAPTEGDLNERPDQDRSAEG